MHMRRARVILALSLALGLFAGTAGSGSASGPNWMHFPWVPNGAMLGTMGPFTGAVTVQNLEGETIAITYHPNIPGAVLKTRDLAAYGSVTLSAAEIGVPSPGSVVRVYAAKKGIGSPPARIAAVQKQSSPVGPHIPSPEARTSAAHQVVDGYTGLTEFGGAKDVVLPIVQTNSGWNSVIRIRVSLADGSTADYVTVTLRPADSGSSQSFTELVSEGEVFSFDLLARGIPAGFVGSAVVSSQNYSVQAIVERYKASTNMLIMNVAQPVSTCQMTHYAPLVFDNFNSWNTGISVANLSVMSNDVTISYYGLNGTKVGDTALSIPANGQNFVYTPSSGTGTGFVGAAVIEGDRPLCAVVDEVKYTGSGGDVGHAMSYSSIGTVASMFTGGLTLPLAQRGSLVTGHGDASGIQVFNPFNASVDVYVQFRDQAGAVALTEERTIPAMQSTTVYSMSVDLPNGFQGSANIYAASGLGGFVAISNNVNYAVQFDGSSSFAPILVPVQ